VEYSAFRIVAAVVPAGAQDSASASAPATCGVAIDVPDSDEYDVSLELYVEMTFEPGAEMSSCGPPSEYDARALFDSSAATAIDSGYAPG
jgi:hypothetical protein